MKPQSVFFMVSVVCVLAASVVGGSDREAATFCVLMGIVTALWGLLAATMEGDK